MSAVKTLVPAPAGAADASRNARGAFAIPMLRSAATPVVDHGDGLEPSFRSLLIRVTRRGSDHPAETASTATKAASKSRKRETTTDSRPSEPVSCAERERRSDRPEDAEELRVTERKKERREDDAVAEETPSAARPAEDASTRESDAAEDVQDAAAEGDSASEARQSVEAENQSDANVERPAVEGRQEVEIHPAAKLLRQLAHQGGGDPARVVSGAVTSQTVVAQIDARTDSQAAAGQSGAPVMSATVNNQAAQPVPGVEGPGQGAGTRQSGVSANGSGGPAASTATELGPIAPAASSPAGELARLVALAAGLADGGSPDPNATQAVGSTGATRSGPRQEPQPGAEQTEARAAMISAGSRPAEAAGTSSRAESFAHVLARGRSGPAEQAANIERVAELVRANVGAKNSSITIRLDPPELGQIQLEARLRDDVLSIHVQAETAAARDLLQSRVDDLRRTLTRHGITIDRFDVESRPAPPAHNGHNANDRNPNWQQQSADGGLSQQWQQRDASSDSAQGGSHGSFTGASEADASGTLSGNGTSWDPASDGIGAATARVPGAPGSSVNVLA